MFYGILLSDATQEGSAEYPECIGSTPTEISGTGPSLPKSDAKAGFWQGNRSETTVNIEIEHDGSEAAATQQWVITHQDVPKGLSRLDLASTTRSFRWL